ncbi:MAG: serine hydrolase [Phormidesmis sp.]
MTSSNDSAQGDQEFLSASQSDPVKMGWMQGFPPPKEKTLSVSDGSFLQFPALRHSAVHIQEFLPTVEVSRKLKAPEPLPYALDSNIDALTFHPGHPKPETSKTITWQASLAENYTDGILILHRGRVVYERYLGALKEDAKHMAMSVSKSFTGTLASILVAEGSLNPEAMVIDYVPELKSSAFGDATVRQVMDMTTSLKFSEEYDNKQAEIWSYSAAGNPISTAKDYAGPVGFFNALKEIKKQGEHGEAFSYKTPNADVLGWIVSRVAGKSVAQLLSERIWSRIGMEQNAYYQVDGLGIPFAGGGLNAGLRDMARFGELIRNKGNWRGEQIFPAAAVEDIEKGGSKAAFAKSSHTELPGWSYRNLWWMLENSHGAFAARGVYGQTIYIDPKAEMVLVRFASYPVAANSANDPTSLPAYAAVADYLLNKEQK